MLHTKKEHPKEKSGLHPRNKHRERYDFKQLIASCPALEPFVKLNPYRDESIDFFNPEAVKMLNSALLKHYYQIDYWDIPENYLCPPIPGRADYIQYMADLLGKGNIRVQGNKIPEGSAIRCLDIGVGANCVYPIIGHQEYGWSFVGTDIDPVAIASASKIAEMNPSLKGNIEYRLQPDPVAIFRGVIHSDERFDLTVCNPPFHASLAEAQAGAVAKLRNLKRKKTAKLILNFGGKHNELWCRGGEEKFVADMIGQSKPFAASCFWFSTLVSKQASLKHVYKALKMAAAVDIQTIPMSQGNKISRIVAWTFLTREEQRKWMHSR